MSATAQLFVKTHVARDLLHNAGHFKTDKLVVWEYVANGLQYTNPGTNPVVKVTLDSKTKPGASNQWDYTVVVYTLQAAGRTGAK